MIVGRGGLLARFQLTDSVRYEHFSTLWRSMGFSDCIRWDRQHGRDEALLPGGLGDRLQVLPRPRSVTRSGSGGLYLLYGFYNTQLATPQSRIRFALKDWHYIQTFLEESVHSRHYDVIYVLRKARRHQGVAIRRHAAPSHLP
ncbi:hypothetical protein CRUP_018312 [Coryphaenoides rupestris]|nr:hypothetical protein CRUP_018312 [Coryphaenoides rupestris]